MGDDLKICDIYRASANYSLGVQAGANDRDWNFWSVSFESRGVDRPGDKELQKSLLALALWGIPSLWENRGRGLMQMGAQEVFLEKETPRIESIPRQVDKKSGGPQGESGLGFSRRRKGQTLFFFSPLHKTYFYSLRSELSLNTTQFKLCTRDYTTTMYSA